MKRNKISGLAAALLVLLAFALAPVQVLADANDMITVQVSGTKNYDMAWEVLDIVNQERAAAGLQPVEMDADLMEDAMLRAVESTIRYESTHAPGRRARGIHKCKVCL